MTWEYWNGAAYASASNVVDDTGEFMVADPVDYPDFPALTFDMPADWKKNLVNGLGPYFILRGRVTTGDVSAIAQPLADRILIGPTEISGVVTDTTNGEFSFTIPAGLFVEPGNYRLQARLQKSSPSSLIRGAVTEFPVKRRGDH